jgi:hypothetical protein
LEQRIHAHLSTFKDFSYFNYTVCEPQDAKDLEIEEIIKHNPKLNKSIPKSEKYKTQVQYKAIIKAALSKKINGMVDDIISNTNVAFHRPATKKMQFTYISSIDIRNKIKEIESMEFIKLGEV